MIKLLLRLLITPLVLFYSSLATANMSSDGLAYNITGDGELLVFIHGSNLDQRMWAPQVAYFSRFAKVLTYDLRGLGASEKPNKPYSDASDLAHLLDEIDEHSATIIGLSAGVQVALDFASAYPQRVNKLVLASPSVNGFVPKQTPPYLADLIAALKQQDFDGANEVMLSSSLLAVPDEYQALVRKMVTSSRQWSLSYEYIQQPSQPVLTRLEQINLPVLILSGQNDVAAITEMAQLLAQ